MLRVVVVCVLLLAGAGCSGQEATAPATTPPTRAPTTSTSPTTTRPPPPVGTSPPNVSTGEGTGARHIEIPPFTLGPGETIGAAFHPSTKPVTVASTASGLEVCPGTTDGELITGVGGWPEPGFKVCRPLDADGRTTLPAVSVSTFHVGVVVRPHTPGPVSVDKLTIDYEAVDGYFLVLGPPIAPGAISPDVTIALTAFTSIRAKATDPKMGTRLPDTVNIEVTQAGRLVESNESTDPERRGRVFGVMNLGVPVTAHIRNNSDQPVSAQLWLEWN